MTIPTICRFDTHRALERVVESAVSHLATRFEYFRVDIVVDEGSEAIGLTRGLAERIQPAHLVIVPRAYITPNGTNLKARANHYACQFRDVRGETRDDMWILHLDDDTAIGADTADEIVAFIAENNTPNGSAGEIKHLGQGILTFPRQNAPNWWTWMADSVRPACDITFFALATGSGRPFMGLHGELLLVRSPVENEIGWDFGPRSIAEDAEFALRFWQRYPGCSGWFAGRSYGGSPATVHHFVAQRSRWAWGLFELAANPTIATRYRLLLAHNCLIWLLAPFHNPLLIWVVAYASGLGGVLPVSEAVVPVWSLNVAFAVLLYSEGYRMNRRASHDYRLRTWERFAGIMLLPIWTLLEATGVALGLVQTVRRAKPIFTVISKPI